jgi:rubrerythrin
MGKVSKAVVELLLKNERAIAKLYAGCAERFPEHEMFWAKLAKEEVRHASIIEKILEKVDDKTIFIDETRFKMRPLEISVEYVSDVTDRLERGEVTLLGALAIASSIEDSIFEGNYFEIFKAESAGLNEKLKILKDETAEHKLKITEMLEKVR